METQRNRASGRALLSPQKLVCRPSARATTVAFRMLGQVLDGAPVESQ